jgi:hypothetical protein
VRERRDKPRRTGGGRGVQPPAPVALGQVVRRDELPQPPARAHRSWGHRHYRLGSVTRANRKEKPEGDNEERDDVEGARTGNGSIQKQREREETIEAERARRGGARGDINLSLAIERL